MKNERKVCWLIETLGEVWKKNKHNVIIHHFLALTCIFESHRDTVAAAKATSIFRNYLYSRHCFKKREEGEERSRRKRQQRVFVHLLLIRDASAEMSEGT